MSEIIIKDLCFAYNKDIDVINNLSLTIEKGQYISILGHNGSGKSTLARLIVGLLKKKSGEIIVRGNELNKENLRKIRRDVAIVFQNPDNQFIGSTVEDDIAFGLENHQVPHEEMQGIIDKLLNDVDMSAFKSKEPSMLSGGQKQRIAIAGVLATNPKIIIFDEATSMLDPRGRSDIASLIEKMRKNNPDLTIISITHDIEEAFLSDEVVVLSKGKIALQGKPTEVFKDREKLKELSLSMPLVMDIIDQLKSSNINIKCEDNFDSLVEGLCQLK